MVLGEKGVGKSTLINSLLWNGIEHSVQQYSQYRELSATLKEGNLDIRVSVLEFPGFGERVEGGDMTEPALRCLEERFDNYFQWEMKAVRQTLSDQRLDACLYLLAPTGHSLKTLDMENLRRLQELVNIIPCLAKADSFTKEELKDFKQSVSLICLVLDNQIL